MPRDVAIMHPLECRRRDSAYNVTSLTEPFGMQHAQACSSAQGGDAEHRAPLSRQYLRNDIVSLDERPISWHLQPCSCLGMPDRVGRGRWLRPPRIPSQRRAGYVNCAARIDCMGPRSQFGLPFVLSSRMSRPSRARDVVISSWSDFSWLCNIAVALQV